MKHLLNEPWVISARHKQLILDLVMRSPGVADLPVQPNAAIPAPSGTNGIGTVRILGPLYNRDDIWTKMFGLTSYESIARQVAKLAADDSVREIILDVDSPGGIAVGADEAAAAIRAAAGVKPVTAVVNGYAASAAYWLASQATRIVVTPLSQVGSIGVISIHADYSAMLEDAGINVSVYRTGSMKALGQITDTHDEVAAAYAAEQAAILQVFAGDVAAGRNMTIEAVLTRFALDSGMEGALAGDTVIGKDAVKLGLADEVTAREVALADIKTRIVTGRRKAMSELAGKQLVLTGEIATPVDAGKQAAEAVAKREEAVAAALGVADLSDASLAAMRQQAADGRQYRADLLDRLHAATIRTEGNHEAGVEAADRAKRVFGNAELTDILHEVTRLENKSVVPTERISAVDANPVASHAVDYSGV